MTHANNASFAHVQEHVPVYIPANQALEYLYRS